jgi:hypothetical protein
VTKKSDEELAREARKLCWCKEMDSYPHPKHPTPRKRKPTPVDDVIAELEGLRDGQKDALGRTLGRAIKALRDLSRGPAALVVITMHAQGKDWLAVGRTEEEVHAALAKKWNEEVPPRGGLTWAKFKADREENPDDYYGATVQHVVPGRAYVDGFDERDGR